jgi:hypothetical protein
LDERSPMNTHSHTHSYTHSLTFSCALYTNPLLHTFRQPIFIPAHLSDKVQPQDTGVNAAFKQVVSGLFHTWRFQFPCINVDQATLDEFVVEACMDVTGSSIRLLRRSRGCWRVEQSSAK